MRVNQAFSCPVGSSLREMLYQASYHQLLHSLQWLLFRIELRSVPFSCICNILHLLQGTGLEDESFSHDVYTVHVMELFCFFHTAGMT